MKTSIYQKVSKANCPKPNVLVPDSMLRPKKNWAAPISNSAHAAAGVVAIGAAKAVARRVAKAVDANDNAAAALPRRSAVSSKGAAKSPDVHAVAPGVVTVKSCNVMLAVTTN